MKRFRYLPLLLIFIYSCNGPDDSKKPTENLNVPITISAKQQIINIPWIDSSLTKSTAGC